MQLKSRILVVGAGFSGAVFARQLAEAGIASLVIDQRGHVSGNCFTKRDKNTGILEHVYGPHVFNTSNRVVWDYVCRFCEMGPYVNRVKAHASKGVFSLPINLLTINQFFGLRLNPLEARQLIKQKGDASIAEPQNFEEQALKFVGPELYEAFFYGYTKKQWGCEPAELPADILKRIPVRFNYDDNYYSSKYQGIPIEGYTTVVQRILDHPLVSVKLNAPWDPAMRDEFESIFFTGPIDRFYDFQFGRLGYRTVYWNRLELEGDYQGNAVINYTALDVAHTRVHEHKHFAPWEEHSRTLVLTEYSKETADGDIPYYPKRLARDKALFASYAERARADEGVFFLGRLATYRYLDMHVVIAEALEFAKQYLAWKCDRTLKRPVFSCETA